MRAELKGKPYEWVSLNNRSKSKKQKQRILEMTDDGIITPEETTPTNTTKPIQPKTQKRKPPEPETIDEDSGSNHEASRNPNSNNSSGNDSVPQNPLTVTPVEQLPEMPE